MRSTIARRLGAAVSVSALALSLGTMPSSATDSPEPFATSSTPGADRPNARLATGADLAGTSAARSSGSAAITATPNANVTKLRAHSGVLNNETENYIDVAVTISNPEEIDDIGLYLTVDGKKTGPYDLWYDEELDVTFVIVPDTVRLGKAKFYGTMIYYTEESAKTPKWDSTDSNTIYVRRDVYFDANAGYSRSASGKTKTFTVESMGIYSPSIDGFRALSKIKLQYKTGGKWKTKKTIYLDEDGYGTYKFVRTKKYYYRIISGQTSTWVGFKKTFPKI